MRISLLISAVLVTFNASAYKSEIRYAPASIQGYTSYGYASTLEKNEGTPSYSRYSQMEDVEIAQEVRDEKVKSIQRRYNTQGVQNMAQQIEMPENVEDQHLEDHTLQNQNAQKIVSGNQTVASPQEISNNAFETLCANLGYSQETETDALAFHECVSHAMKTKMTEETMNKTQYYEIDTNVSHSLKANPLLDKTIESLTYHNQLITQRNKMDCLKQKDYQRCIKAISEYKMCYNKAVDFVKFEHETNKITCYTKTGLRFANPDSKQVHVRDAYFGMCMHLIEKDLKANFIKQNATCNKALTASGFTKLVI